MSIISILHMLAGLGVIIGGAAVILLGAIPDFIDASFEAGVLVTGAIMIVGGLIIFGIGLALFSGKTWGWWFATIMTVVMLIFSVYSFEILPIIFGLIVLLYLTSRNTRGWFKNKSQGI